MDIYTPIRPNLPQIPNKINEEEIRAWMVNISDAISDAVDKIRKDIIAIITAEGL